MSVFGVVDRGGDRMMPGAFGKTLADWGEKDAPIPIIWSHMWDNPEAHIGEADPDDVVESDDGLLVKRGRIDLDRPFAAQVFHLLERRRVKEFSFGYQVRDFEVAKDGAYNLLDVELFEIGPTLKGMNPETELLAVKALATATDPVDTPALAALAAPVEGRRPPLERNDRRVRPASVPRSTPSSEPATTPATNPPNPSKPRPQVRQAIRTRTSTPASNSSKDD